MRCFAAKIVLLIFLYVGAILFCSAKHIIEDSFDLNEVEEGTFLNGMVSRKKQILPAIMEVLGKK